MGVPFDGLNHYCSQSECLKSKSKSYVFTWKLRLCKLNAWVHTHKTKEILITFEHNEYFLKVFVRKHSLVRKWSMSWSSRFLSTARQNVVRMMGVSRESMNYFGQQWKHISVRCLKILRDLFLNFVTNKRNSYLTIKTSINC